MSSATMESTAPTDSRLMFSARFRLSRYPVTTTSSTEEPPRDGNLAWDMAFFAVPRQRLEGHFDGRSDYLAVLAAATPGRTFDFCTLDELVNRARERLAQTRCSQSGGSSQMHADQGERDAH